MIILDKAPATIDLNTHGGVTVHFDNFSIWNTVGKTWGVMIRDTYNLHEKDGKIKNFDFFVDAYEAGVKETA